MSGPVSRVYKKSVATQCAEERCACPMCRTLPPGGAHPAAPPAAVAAGRRGAKGLHVDELTGRGLIGTALAISGPRRCACSCLATPSETSRWRSTSRWLGLGLGLGLGS
eukprot:scaffold35481_cov63-Phaeocystis_antarctica.AAC.1